jgi:hypothetical protein
LEEAPLDVFELEYFVAMATVKNNDQAYYQAVPLSISPANNLLLISLNKRIETSTSQMYHKKSGGVNPAAF